MDIKTLLGVSGMRSRENMFKINETNELKEFRNKQAMTRINDRNEQIKLHNQCLDELHENNIVDMLKISDFVYIGSNKQTKRTKDFNNCYFPTVLKKMVSQKKLGFKKFNSCGSKPSAFYYNKLSDDEVDSMTREEMESKAF